MKLYSCVKNLVNWIDTRLPIFTFLHNNGPAYMAPRNLNYLWNFGFLAMLTLLLLIATGVFLAMNYTPHVDMAFDSVERIMRDVNYGWLIRYTHANAASMFFLVIYIHMARGLYYGSYKNPREMLWLLGVILFFMMIATAFLGYVLPWGQMSFWAATVITNLFSAIPVFGESIVQWLWGGFSVGNPTLNRFYALHYLLPMILSLFVFLHIWALRVAKSNNPLGIDVKSPEDTIPFHPYYIVKDVYSMGIFLIFFFAFVFWMPNYLGHPDNYIPADPLNTPPHIVPEWYFLPFYAILRAVPDKLGGVVLMLSAIIVLCAIPWLDRSKIRSCMFRPMYKWFVLFFFVNFILLGYAGSQPAEGIYLFLGRFSTIWYFLHFLVITPLVAKFEVPKPLPESISSTINNK